MNHDPGRDPYRRTGDEADLPEGKTCGDCIHIPLCFAVFGHGADDEVCDWAPIRFKQAEQGRA